SYSGSTTAATSTASAPLQAASVSSGSGCPVVLIASPPNGRRSSSTSGASASSTRVAAAITSGPMPSPGRHTIPIEPSLRRRGERRGDEPRGQVDDVADHDERRRRELRGGRRDLGQRRDRRLLLGGRAAGDHGRGRVGPPAVRDQTLGDRR